MNYRSEIDGLRALAVVPVILFHAGFELFSGGFVGVDVFFVISGYLITTILITDIEKKRFSLINFYERRARRILPALYFVLIVAMIYGFYTSPFYARDMYQSIFATTIFSENILLYVESSNYFDLATENKLLFHTWSLGVEEQFYLLFPVFLFFTWKFGKNKVIWMIIIFLIISLLLSELGWRKMPSANFYLAPTRVWEIFAGSIAAFIVLRNGVKSSNILSLLGLSAIIFGIFAFDKTTPFPSVYALVPVIGVVLLILFADKETIVAKLLSTKVFVGIGLISYSAYLWHQPIIVLFERELEMLVEPNQKVYLSLVAVLITSLISIFTYFYIEKPFRFSVPKKYFNLVVVSVTIILLSISYLGHKSVGFEKLKLSLFAENKNLYINHFSELEKKLEFNWGEQSILPNAKILVIGDSTAHDFKAALKSKGIATNILGLGKNCYSKLLKNEASCLTTLSEILKTASSYKYVFIANNFVKENHVRNALAIREIISKVVETYIVNSFHFQHASDLSYKYLTNINKEEIGHIAFKSIHPKYHKLNHILLESAELVLLDKYSFFCDEVKKKCKFYGDNGSPLFHDELHLTVEGFNFYGDELIKFLCERDKMFCY